MRKYLMSLLAAMFLLSSLTLFAQPRPQDATPQEAPQSSTAKTPKKKAKKEKKAKTKKEKKAKKTKGEQAPQ